MDPVALRSPEMTLDYAAFCELLRRCAGPGTCRTSGCAWRATSRSMSSARSRWSRGWSAACGRRSGDHREPRHPQQHYRRSPRRGGRGRNRILILDKRDDAPTSRENTELMLASGQVGDRQIADAPMRWSRWRSVHDKGSSSRAVAALFRLPDPLSRRTKRSDFDRALLDRPIERSDVAYHALIRRYLASARLRSRGGSRRTCAPRSPGRWSSAIAAWTASRRACACRRAACSGGCRPRGCRCASWWTSGAGPGRCRWSPIADCRCRKCGGAGLFRAECLHPGVPPLVRRHAAALSLAERRGSCALE